MRAALLTVPVAHGAAEARILQNHLRPYVGLPVHAHVSPQGVAIAFEYDDSHAGAAEWLRVVHERAELVTRAVPGRGEVAWRFGNKSLAPGTVTVSADTITHLLAKVERAKRERESVEEFARQQEQVLASANAAEVYDQHNGDRTAALVVYRLARKLNRPPTYEEMAAEWQATGLASIVPEPERGWQATLERVAEHCAKTFKPAGYAYRFGQYEAHLRTCVPETALRVEAKQTKADGSPRKGARRSVSVTYADLDIALISATLAISGKDRQQPKRYGAVSTRCLVAYFTSVKQYTGRGCSKDKANLLMALLTRYQLIRVAKAHYTFNNRPDDNRLYRLGPNHPEYIPFDDDPWALI